MIGRKAAFLKQGKGVEPYPQYGGVKVSTGIVRYGKRVVALDHYKTDNFQKQTTTLKLLWLLN